MNLGYGHDELWAPLRLAHVVQQNRSFTQNLRVLHEGLRSRYAQVERIGVALYDAKTGEITGYAHSGGDIPSLHSIRLDEHPGLVDAVRRRTARNVPDLQAHDAATQRTLHPMLSGGVRASYALPMFDNDELIGFLFFDSLEPDAFAGEVGGYLDLFGSLIASTVAHELSAVQTLVGTIHLARTFAHLRDVETGIHLDRMARYARLIAQHLAPAHGRDEEFVEHIFLFAPLHDIGKIGIPDSILLKPGRLDPDERRIMETHVTKGIELIALLIEDFRLHALRHVGVLRNIVAGHHERLDGSGYPLGLQGDEVALEARITAVADVFDALTGPRPYKRTWSNDEA
ncbi:MAG: HD domain-containing protein, partial [Rhodocyclaceae bacterium]|nr:HD domain-containing protein [Rhodocyclaceae bacterium]